MKRKFKLFNFLILLTFLVLPFSVKAIDEEPIHFNLPSEPVVGQKASSIAINQYINIQEQYWVNYSEHRLMTSNETFEANKIYGYAITYSFKSEIDYDWFTDLVDSDYVVDASYYDYNDGIYYAEAYFYMGDSDQWVFNPTDDEYYELDIDIPEVRGHIPLAQTNSKYTIIDQTWLNTTDNCEMGPNDVFEGNKGYKYTVTVKSYYFESDALAAFNDMDEFYLGSRYGNHAPFTETISGYFFFGDTSNFFVSTGDVIIQEDNPPTTGEHLLLPRMLLTDTVEAYAKWEVLDGTSYTDAEVNEEVVEGNTYRYFLELVAAPGYSFEDDFEVIDENKNENFIVAEGENWGFEYIYTSTFTILPDDTTIGIYGEHFVYPGFTTRLSVYPSNDVNADVTWASSNESIATIDEDGYVTGVAPGTVEITATNSLNDTATFDMEVGVPVEGMEVQSEEITMYVGDYQRLRASVLPENATNQEFDWEVDLDLNHQYGDDYNVGAISLLDDWVFAEEVGTVKVDAVADYDDSIRATVTIHVVERPVEVERVSFEQNRFEIFVGDSITLAPVVTPDNAADKTLTWEVVGNNYISFNEGTLTVTGLSAGTGRVIARSNNNKSASCSIIVKERPPEVEEVVFQDHELEIEVGEQKTLQVNYIPANSYTEYVVWVSEDPTTVSVTDGVIKGLKAGTTTITVTTANNKFASIDVTVVTPINFNDVPRTQWYYESVREAYNRGIIAGYNANSFGPNDKVTRGQLVTFLWRIEGSPSSSSLPNSFPDVKSGQYYTDAVLWAASKDIVHGYASGKFGPNEPIIRQDLAVILNNYARYLGLDCDTEHDLSGFVDYNKIRGKYSEPALKWAVHYGIMSGRGLANGKRAIAPSDNTSRAEAAAMIVNLVKKFDI